MYLNYNKTGYQLEQLLKGVDGTPEPEVKLQY